MSNFEQLFEEQKERNRKAALHHKRSVIHNQLERVKIGVQESGDDDLLEDFEVLEQIVQKLVEELWEE